jgi:hypothetical protein
MKGIGPKYLNACSLNGTTHAEKQAETGCTLGFALDYYFSQVTNFIVHFKIRIFFTSIVLKLLLTNLELVGLYGHRKLK